jgi:hypothetical protein
MSTWYERIIEVHLAVTDQVSHYERLNGDRYFVWQEDKRDDFLADGRHTEKAVTGTTDLFTKTEFDPWVEAFEKALDAADGILWYQNSVQYEEETGFIHHEWVWTVI